MFFVTLIRKLFVITAFLCFNFLFVQAQVIRIINWSDFPNTGDVSEDDMKTYGGFDYANRGFGNGPESNYNDAFNLSIVEDPTGNDDGGMWAKLLSQTWPGDQTVHTFGKAIRAINNGNTTAFSYSEFWIDVPLYIPEAWITHDQGKLGYSLSNPEGTSPGTNPTEEFEMLFHYFSPNNFKTNKPEAPWYSENPNGTFEEQDMLIGLDAYCADDRINTNYSEPIFFKENLDSDTRKIFEKEVHYVLRAHVKLNTPNASDGILEAWYSEDGGDTWTKAIEVLDFNWRGSQNDHFEKEGFVAFRGGSGHGFEVGGNGAVSKNTGQYNEPQDTWFYLGNIMLYDLDPFETILDFNILHLSAVEAKAGVLVSWELLDHVESFVVQLQKSTDGVLWNEIFETYHHSNPTPKEYMFTDTSPKPGANYYRLKKNAINGEIEYSNIVAYDLKESHISFKVFPNPASNMLLIDAPSLLNNKGAKLLVMDMTGKIIVTLEDLSSKRLDISHLQEGVYYLYLIQGTELLKQHQFEIIR